VAKAVAGDVKDNSQLSSLNSQFSRLTVNSELES
jgi:hypothetical protein